MTKLFIEMICQLHPYLRASQQGLRAQNTGPRFSQPGLGAMSEGLPERPEGQPFRSKASQIALRAEGRHMDESTDIQMDTVSTHSTELHPPPQNIIKQRDTIIHLPFGTVDRSLQSKMSTCNLPTDI